jgi:Tol biopolymer transport system component
MRIYLGWILTLALAAGLAVVLWLPRHAPPPAFRQVVIDAGAEAEADRDAVNYGPSAILSPDGSLLAFQGHDSRLYVRRLDELKALPLPGTEDARDPFFSPDGKWIAFFNKAQLRKVSSAGGQTGAGAVAVADVESDRGGAWAENGAIYFSTLRGPVMRAAADGVAKPQPLIRLNDDDREVTQRWPQALDHDRVVLYTANATAGDFEGAFGVVQNLQTGRRKVVHRGGFHYRYLPSGHIVFVSQAVLYAVPFDLTRMETTGEPAKILEGIASQPQTGGAQLSSADDGSVLYVPAEPGKSVISWLDHAGRTQPLLPAQDNYFGLSIAPDGKRLAFGVSDGRQANIGIFGIFDQAQAAPRLLTSITSAAAPLWTPDGQRIVYTNSNNISWQRADGTGVAQRLTQSMNLQTPESWHPSGMLLAFREYKQPNRNDIRILHLKGDEASGWRVEDSTTFLSTSADEFGAAFSPDGRWLAYASDGSGRYQVYVRPFPGPGSPWPVSLDGGTLPVWSRHGSQLLFRDPDGRIMTASWSVTEGRFETERPVPWTTGEAGASKPLDFGQARGFDLHPDGQRLAVITMPVGQPDHRLVLALGFFDELRRRTGR